MKRPTAFLISLIAAAGCAFAQNPAQQPTVAEDTRIVVQPLFDYPSAPENIEGLEGKSDYVMMHFWDPMDFKSKNAVDQFALNHAFSVYCAAIPYASRQAVIDGVSALLKKLNKNPVLTLQFTKAAEENLYGNNAGFWADEVYIPFLKQFVATKKIDAVRKLKYERQLKLLSNSQPGTPASPFTFTKPNGTQGNYFPMSTPTLIEFGNPGCQECRMARLKLESNAALNAAIDKGLVSVLFIIPDAEDGWEKGVENFNRKWSVGASEDVADIYDIRLSPTFYVIGGDGKIIVKNIGVENAISTLLENAEKKTNPQPAEK